MIDRFYNLEGWHEIRQHLTRGGLRILAILALALTLLGASPSLSAQAAPAKMTIKFDITVIPSAKYVCANESMTFRVFVIRRITSKNPDIPTALKKISGTPIDATVADRSIGTITPDRLETTGSGTYEPGVAEFTFTAGENPGKTNIFFEGWLISGWWGEKLAAELYLSQTAQVDVRKCGYKVELIQQHFAQYDFGWIAKGDKIRLNADSPEAFSGTTDFKYIYDIPSWAICVSATNTPTKVDYSVDLVGDKLYLTYTISAHSTTSSAPCIGFSQTVESPSLSGTVLLPSTGGEALIENPYTLHIIIVERVVDP